MLSHTLFNGGVLAIPDDQTDNFIVLLAKDIAEGKQWCIAEKISPQVFAMYMDFDFHSRAAYDCLDQILPVYHELISMYYPDHDVSCLTTNVCIRDAYENDPEHIGVHIITPELHVNVQRAVLFARHLQHILNERIPGHDWNGIIDKGVYNNGLRTTYNYKTKDCTVCLTERKRVHSVRKERQRYEDQVTRKIEEWKVQFPESRTITIADCIANFPGVTSIEQLRANGARIQLISAIQPSASFWKAIQLIMLQQVPEPPPYPSCEDSCQGAGQIFIQRRYDLESQLVGFQRQPWAMSSVPRIEDVERVLHMTRIRRTPNTSLTEPYRIPTPLPITIEDTSDSRGMRPGTAMSGRSTGAGASGAKIASMSDQRIVSVVNDPDDQRMVEVGRVIQSIRPQYRFVQIYSLMMASTKTTEKKEVRKIKTSEKRIHENVSKYAIHSRLPYGIMSFYKDGDVLQVDRVWVTVTGEGAHYCHNKQDSHGNNHIYFEIANTGEIFQRCHSTKQFHPSGPQCDSYRFKLGNLPSKVQKLLFPVIRTDTFNPVGTDPHMISDPEILQNKLQSDMISVMCRYFDFAMTRFKETGSTDFKSPREERKEKEGGGQGGGGGGGRRRQGQAASESEILNSDTPTGQGDPEEEFIRQTRKRNQAAAGIEPTGSSSNGLQTIMDLMPALHDAEGLTTTARKKQKQKQQRRRGGDTLLEY